MSKTIGEATVRKMARRRGHLLQKSRARDPKSATFGKYRVCKPYREFTPCGGAGFAFRTAYGWTQRVPFNATLAECAAYVQDLANKKPTNVQLYVMIAWGYYVPPRFRHLIKAKR